MQVPSNGPNFTGLGGEVRYLGLKMDLNNTDQFTYGWIGVRIDNEADATGAVVGYAYETTPNTPIAAGAVPEPSSLLMTIGGATALVAAGLRRRRRRS